MFWWAKELLSCFRFLAVSGDKGFWRSKRVYEVVLPFLLSLPLFLLFMFYPGAFAQGFLGKFLSLLFQFMVFVVPFHLAALAAFATFERKGLDEPLSGTNAQITVWSNAENRPVATFLTLRQYASLLFGYLCSIGIIFIIIYLIASNLAYDAFMSKEVYDVFKLIAAFISMLFVAHYSVLSAYAITFLFDKINKIGAPLE